MKLLKRVTQSPLKSYSRSMTRETDGDLPIQTGVLPWRLAANKGIEVLLVTSRRSGRWIIPKGWPMPGKSLAEAAAQEAFEEAGVTGTVDPKPLGSFRHSKQTVGTGDVEVNILVHPMWVDREFQKWPEIGERKRRWFSPKDAAKRVDSLELGELIRQTAKRSLRQPG